MMAPSIKRMFDDLQLLIHVYGALVCRYLAFGSAVVILGVGLNAKPDTSFRNAARATAAEQLEAAGHVTQYSKDPAGRVKPVE
jgi:hypothetical protein